MPDRSLLEEIERILEVRLPRIRLYSAKIKDCPVEVLDYIIFDGTVNSVRVRIYLDSSTIASYIDTAFTRRSGIKIKDLGKTLPVLNINGGEGEGITS